MIYTIASGKGGVGKTSTAINLGAAMNKLKEDIVILDGNLTTPNVGLYFGAPIVPVSLNHVLNGEAKIDEAIYEHESGTKIIPCSLSLKDLNEIKYNKLKNETKKLRNLTNHIIIDSAAGLGQEAKLAIQVADEVIVVTNPNILSVTDALKTIKYSEEIDKPVKGIIITRVKGDKTEMSIESIKEMLETPILAIIPEDNSVQESLIRRNAVIHTKPKSKASRAYQKLAAKLLGKEIQNKSVFSRVLRSLGF